jgi:hypothetical protein
MPVTLKELLFTIAAAKSYHEATSDFPHHDVPDWKVIDDADNVLDAVEKFNSVRDYPIVEFHLESTWSDGSRTRVPVFGGLEEQLVNGQWRQTNT